MKAVQLLVNSVLPPDLRNYDQTYDSKSLNKILHAVALKHPDQFAEIEKKISDIGRKASYYQGETITLKDLASPIDKLSIFAAMDAELDALPKNKDYEENKIAIMQKYNTLIEKETSKAALEQRNNIAMSVLSGARGKSAQLKAMTSTPGTFSDYKGRVVPVFSKESFADGIRPAVFLASTNGSRASVVSTKSATAKGGDLAKQLASSSADLVVRKENCGTDNGIELSIDDGSLRGRALVRDTAGIKAGTFIDRVALDKLRKAGVDSVVVRSPLTCAVSNGLCAHCVGRFYNGSKLPKVGDSIGLLASSTVGEPLTQMALSAKHTAGMSTSAKSYSGLPTIIQFTQSPEAFKDRGAVAELDGKVTSVEEAPQGGMFVTVGDKKHYVLPGHEVYVKPGDSVEAGDQLAEGLVDPEDIVRLKGLGDGKLYYAERLNQMLKDSGAGTDKRNTEVLARGAIRHIKITNPEGMGSYLPDDVVDYNAAQKTYKIPDTAREMNVKEAVGKYLQKPYLHYTVGTKITPTVAKKLAKNSYNSVLVDQDSPGFEPYMVRLRTASHTNPDWMASLATSSIAKQLNEAATRGDDTNINSNPDFRPRLAIGENFGKNVTETGEF